MIRFFFQVQGYLGHRKPLWGMRWLRIKSPEIINKSIGFFPNNSGESGCKVLEGKRMDEIVSSFLQKFLGLNMLLQDHGFDGTEENLIYSDWCFTLKCFSYKACLFSLKINWRLEIPTSLFKDDQMAVLVFRQFLFILVLVRKGLLNLKISSVSLFAKY